jgi:hypothetical protein
MAWVIDGGDWNSWPIEIRAFYGRDSWYLWLKSRLEKCAVGQNPFRDEPIGNRLAQTMPCSITLIGNEYYIGHLREQTDLADGCSNKSEDEC